MGNAKRWFENYWYHYKWHTIVGLFAVIFAVILIGQMIAKDDIDANVIYAGPYLFASSEIYGVQNAFAQVMRDDYTGDGKKTAVLIDITMLTEQQMTDKKAEAEAEGINDLILSPNDNREMKKKFNLEIFAGESIICLFDPYWFDYINEASGLLPLNEALGYMPEYALNEYGVYLKDTNFGQYFTIFEGLPDDTILCIRRMTTTSIFKGVSKEQDRYDNHLQIFKDIFAFELKTE